MLEPIKYTCLGFQFLHLIDKGEILDLEETKLHIRFNTLFFWLNDTYKDFDFSIYSLSELGEIESHFESISNANDSSKYGISKNGLSLLAAYCFESLQGEI